MFQNCRYRYRLEMFFWMRKVILSNVTVTCEKMSSVFTGILLRNYLVKFPTLFYNVCCGPVVACGGVAAFIQKTAKHGRSLHNSHFKIPVFLQEILCLFSCRDCAQTVKNPGLPFLGLLEFLGLFLPRTFLGVWRVFSGFSPVVWVFPGFGRGESPCPKLGPCHLKNTTVILIHYGGGQKIRR